MIKDHSKLSEKYSCTVRCSKKQCLFTKFLCINEIIMKILQNGLLIGRCNDEKVNTNYISLVDLKKKFFKQMKNAVVLCLGN